MFRRYLIESRIQQIAAAVLFLAMAGIAVVAVSMLVGAVFSGIDTLINTLMYGLVP